MGQITVFNINKLIEYFNCKIYVETGTGIGVSLQYAINHPFDELYTIDIDKELLESTKKNITDSRVKYINGFSTEALRQIIPNIKKEIPILFFLDAHLPGADFHKMSYEDSMKTYKEHSLPLEEELKIISSMRDVKNDVIVIDDLQLYDDGPYQHKTWIHEELQTQLGLRKSSNFIFEMFNQTHKIEKLYAHQGYLLLTPKRDN